MTRDDWYWAIDKVRKKGSWAGDAGITFNQLSEIVYLVDKRAKALANRHQRFLDGIEGECLNPND